MVLDLSGADLKGFDAIPSAPYNCIVHEVTEVTVESDEGKLPKGTPGYNVQFRVDGETGDKEQFNNRRLFQRYYVLDAEADYDEDKKAKLNGMFARFLLAIGYGEKEVTSGKFKFDPTDAEERECIVVVGQREYQGEIQNNVRNVKPRSENLEEAGII